MIFLRISVNITSLITRLVIGQLLDYRFYGADGTQITNYCELSITLAQQHG